MSRPLSGTKEGDLATARWRQTMQMRYGDITKKMQEVGRKGGLVKTPTGGFASTVRGSDGRTGPERARIAGAIGGKISKRRRDEKSN